MPLVAGPFHLLSTGDLQIQAVKPDFTAYTSDGLADLDTYGAAMDAALIDMALFAAEPEDLAADLLLDGVFSTLSITEASHKIGSLAGFTDLLTLGDTQLAAASGFAPAAAFTNPPTLYTPPDTSLTVPGAVLNPAGYNAANTGVIGRYSDRPRPNISIFNTTRIGQSNFWVGDNFAISVQATKGDYVSVQGSLNGESFGLTVLGQADENGLLALTGTQGQTELGVWHQDWYVNGVFVISFDFTVFDA